MNELDEILMYYRDHVGIKSDRANEIHRAACIEVAQLREAAQRTQATGYQTAIIPCPHCGVNITVDSDMIVASG